MNACKQCERSKITEIGKCIKVDDVIAEFKNFDIVLFANERTDAGVKMAKLDKYQKATYNILYIMMNSYEKTKLYERKLNYLPYQDARYLANEIIYAYKVNGTLVLADFITSLNEKENLLNLVKEILKNVSDDESNFEAFEDYMQVIREYSKNQEIKRLKNLMSEENNPVKKAEILEKIRLVKIGE